MFGMLSVMYGSRHFSSILTTTARSDIGLYDLPWCVSLFGFGIGMMFASFHECGMMFLFDAVLSNFVRYASPSGPRCLMCLMFRLFGPVQLEFLLCFMAAWTSSMVRVSVSVFSLCTALSIALFDLCVLRVTVFVNCLLNAFAI